MNGHGDELLIGIASFVAGLFIGSTWTMAYFWKYLQGDPDGPGGWRTRMQAMTTEHNARVNSTTTDKP